jgi:hypothetical protein
MSDEPPNPHRAYMEGLQGRGPRPASGPLSNAWDEGDRQRRASAAGAEAFGSPAPASSAAPIGFPSSPGARPAGGTVTEVSGRLAGILGWLTPLLLAALVLVALGPRRGDALATLWVLLVPLWVGLYPLNGLATAGTYLWLHQMLPQAPGAPNVPAAAAALVVFVVTQRLEHRLARQAAYRVPRHLVRLSVFGLAAYAQLLRYQGHLLVDPVPLHVSRFLRNPTPVVVAVVGTVVVAHLLLWPDNRTRRGWHQLLEALHLRERGA